MTKHLYIHIPFCSNICWYCDFKRSKNMNELDHYNYVIKLIEQVKKESIPRQYKTIYLGGGTPNILSDKNLELLLNTLVEYMDDNCEFSIECNPELITKEQLLILQKYKVNRISVGIQSCTDHILKSMNRNYDFTLLVEKFELLKQFDCFKISVDFIYNYFEMQLSDLVKVFKFIESNDFIKHVSFYALEIKENSRLKLMNYSINTLTEEIQMLLIKTAFKRLKFKRYEISNWSKDKENQSEHNKAYWKYKDWKGIGLGAVGKENNISYEINYDSNKNFIKESRPISEHEHFLNQIIMGLRQVKGIDLNIEENLNAYNYFKDKIKFCTIKNNHLKANNIDCLNDCILDLFDTN